jgi:hypothetical protein
MTPSELAQELGISPKTLRAWLRETYSRRPHERYERWLLSEEQIRAARERWGGPRTAIRSPSPATRAAARRTRGESDEAYVIDLCDEILAEAALRQHRFRWLVGDPGRGGRRATLPVDAFYPGRGLVIEYRELQHDEPVPFFDRRDTVSGVGRGAQRFLYDERREMEIRRHGLRLVIFRPKDLASDSRGRLRRNRERDLEALRRILGV